MEYNNIQIGKIRNIDYSKGVAEIVTSNQKYLFILEDNNLQEGDIVKFRAEIINDTPKAFFAKKVDLANGEKEYKVLKSKTYHI